MIAIEKQLKEHDIILLNNDIYNNNFFFFHSPDFNEELYKLVKNNFKHKHDKVSLFIQYIQKKNLEHLPTGFAKNYTFFINGNDSIMAATLLNNDNKQNRHLSLSVYNKDFEYLYNIAYEDNKPFINSSNFFYYEASNRIGFREHNFDLIYLKEKNTIRIEKPSINLTSIQFEEQNSIVCKFKKSDFSRLVLDENLNIKEIELSSTFKKELNLSGKVVLSDISAYSLHDIHSVINEKLQHEVELYNLLNDKKIAFKNRASFFERDLLYLKEVLQNKETIINNFEESTVVYKKILNYFSEYDGLNNQSKSPLFDDLEYFSIHQNALKVESDKLFELYDKLANYSKESLKFSQLNKKIAIKKQP